MQLNTDFSQRCVVDTTALPWQPSPSPLVHRRLIERDGGEQARATSIVRYDPGATFSAHRHDLGEEIIVLDGVFSDETGDYGPGTYLRNPPGSGHAPSSQPGCTLFVKLRHLAPDDRQQHAIDTRHSTDWRQGLMPGLQVLPLAGHGSEHTALVRWAPGTRFTPHRHAGGEEILVLEGVFSDEHGDYPAGTWLRSPDGSVHQPFSDTGCLIWVKTGHLPRG